MVERLVAAVKDKKELRGLSDAFVAEKVSEYFSAHGKAKKLLEENGYNVKSAVFKQAVKEVRSGLRDAYGLFQNTSAQKRRKLFLEYVQAKGRGEKLRLLDALLASHQSTKERKDHYDEYYRKIFAATGKPSRILDLGCGYNPLSYRWLGCEPAYEASDIASADVELLEEFFVHEGVAGEAYVLDLLDDTARRTRLGSTTADVVFLLKLIDTLEGQRRDVTKTIIKELLCNKHVRWVVATFPLQSMSGKPMRAGGKESWFTRFLNKEGYAWQRMETGGEDVYLIKRS